MTHCKVSQRDRGFQDSEEGELEAQSRVSWKLARRQNAEARDFTVNAMMYDPFSCVIFDYCQGVADCRKHVLRTIADPEASFSQDPARILRAVRLAARAGLKIEDGTARAIQKCSQKLLDLPIGRISMELQALLAYGSSVESVRLLWKLKLLDLIFPVLARYLKANAVPRDGMSAAGEEPLFKFLEAMDTRATPEKLVPNAIWLAVLAAPVVHQRAGRRDPPLKNPRKRSNSRRRKMKAAASKEGAEKQQAEQKSDSEDEEDFADDTNRNPEAAAHRKVVGEVMDEFIDGAPVAGIVPRSAKRLVVKLLVNEHLHHLQVLKGVLVTCNSCGKEERLQATTAEAKCRSCGNQFKKLRIPHVHPLTEMLQECQKPV